MTGAGVEVKEGSGGECALCKEGNLRDRSNDLEHGVIGSMRMRL